ncbi:MAG TPA: hypothetical protein VFF78_06425 [Anaerolineaceae bacterium]|nr:hypothetical protein [Anaerolineaceae bacterium]
MNDLDLFYFLLNSNAADVPGLLVTAPGRRPARGRGDDRLIVWLHLLSASSMSAEKQREMTEEAARLYFETPGSVTAGLRFAFEQINQIFLERNLHGVRGSEQWIGSLNMAVLRRGYLYLAQAGSLHSYVLGEQVEHFYDPASDGRGLGISRSVTIRFFQAEIHSTDNLAMCIQPPASWSVEALANSQQISLDALRRRLLNQAGADLSAVVLRFQTGKGQIHRLRLRTTGPEQAPVAAPTPLVDRVEIAPSAVPTGDLPVEEAENNVDLLAAPPEPLVPPVVAEIPAPFPEAVEEPVVPAPVTKKPVRPAVAARPAASRRNQPLRKQVGRVWFGWQNLKQRTGSGFSRFIARLLPNAAESSPRLSPGVMFFIAIAVPLIVVGIATAIYFRNGLEQQHRFSLQAAQQKAAEVTVQTDALTQRQGWSEVLTLLDDADQYGPSDVSRQLRAQAYTEIDRLDNVTRLELVPFGGNNELKDTQISRIVSSDTEVYLLDVAGNGVKRLVLVNQGTRYSLDAQFQCSGGRGTGMGGLVDMVIFPNFDRYKSALLAADDTGGLMVCIAGQNASYKALLAPEGDFGKISALAYDQGVLYVLDSQPEKNMIWRYTLNSEDQDVVWNTPAKFFTGDVPRLQDVVDITAYDNQLYLLFQDGTVSQCIYDVYTGLPAECKKTISYTDLRTGQSNLPFGFSGVRLSQVQTVLPPDASIFLLDVQGPGIYHFGLGLETLNRVLRPRLNTEYPLPENPLTAFAISQGTPRMVVLAFVNQIYYGSIQY